MKQRKVAGKYTKWTKAAVIVILVFSVSLISACGKSKAAVIIAGSTSVQPFAEILAQEYMTLYSGIDIDVQGGGSSAGIMAARSEIADIGMSSRALNDKELDLWNVEIAKDGLAIVINPENPIQNLTLDQIRDIYTGEVSDWSELGGLKGKIHIVAREDGSGTRSAFESLVMGKKTIDPRAIVLNFNGAIKQFVSGDPNSIGFISLGLVDDNVKALSIDGVAATIENVINGSYNLFRPFIFVSNKEPEGLAKQFIDFTLSEEGKRLLLKEGLIPH